MLIEDRAEQDPEDAQLDATPLHIAGVRGHADVASWLLELRADKDGRTWDGGEGPLHFAI